MTAATQGLNILGEDTVDVEVATQDLNVIGQDTVGGLVTRYIFDNPPKQTASLEIHPLSLQEFFIQMVGHKGHKGGAVR